MKVEFTEEQVKNLKIFLSRVDLKGGEVPAFVEIINLVSQKGEINEV